MIHPLADVQSQHIGKNTIVWQFAVILPGARIGENCNINCHTFIEDDVRIGNNVSIKSGVFLWNGITIEDDVFIGPNVTFTNDIYPRSKNYISPVATFIHVGASLAANSTILAGVTIGKYSITGIGSVVVKNIPDYALAYGNPAKVMGWVDEKGRKLLQIDQGKWMSSDNQDYLQAVSGLEKL